MLLVLITVAAAGQGPDERTALTPLPTTSATAATTPSSSPGPAVAPTDSTQAPAATSLATAQCERPSADAIKAIEAGMDYGNQRLTQAWVVSQSENGQQLVASISKFANGNTYAGVWAVNADHSAIAVSDWAQVYTNLPKAEDAGGWRTEEDAQRAIDDCAAAVPQ